MFFGVITPTEQTALAALALGLLAIISWSLKRLLAKDGVLEHLATSQLESAVSQSKSAVSQEKVANAIDRVTLALEAWQADSGDHHELCALSAEHLQGMRSLLLMGLRGIEQQLASGAELDREKALEVIGQMKQVLAK